MNAAETIRAAIDRLEGQSKLATPGPWEVRYTLGRNTWPVLVSYGVGVIADIAEYGMTEEDTRLIATLHRTIDAQIAILREALNDLAWDTTERPPYQAPFYSPLAEQLARAILGEASHD